MPHSAPNAPSALSRSTPGETLKAAREAAIATPNWAMIAAQALDHRVGAASDEHGAPRRARACRDRATDRCASDADREHAARSWRVGSRRALKFAHRCADKGWCGVERLALCPASGVRRAGALSGDG